jgi:hypothetical protein
MTNEKKRLKEYADKKANWKEWGPYLSERAWGTVREDYSPDGDAWKYFSHKDSRSRTYRWNEDGLGGISDRNQYVCFAWALWNGKDECLKERLFGLTGPQGNHGEDVKEYYFYLDNTPSHSYMKMLYKYPQRAFPYQNIVDENSKRGILDFEYELLDTGVFEGHRYFDAVFEYAKVDVDDLLLQASLFNRGPDEAFCAILPTIWFRNTWDWGYPQGPMNDVDGKPIITRKLSESNFQIFEIQHPAAGRYFLYAEGIPECVYTENSTNNERVYAKPNVTPYVKDAFHDYLVNNRTEAVNPDEKGTKAAAIYRESIPAGGVKKVRLRLTRDLLEHPFSIFDEFLQQRQIEANEFYSELHPKNTPEEEVIIQRQAFAGLLWSKQLYYFDLEQWLRGDPLPAFSCCIERQRSRNSEWEHLVNFDILSMPDKWEYPWYASWDLAFHALALVLIDPDFAKRQLVLMTREWYMHPNGQLPAYEWSFSDVNPPVHAWAAWRVYKIDQKRGGKPDKEFLRGIFHKLLLNFTWWVNRKDHEGRNIFQGGFLGMDNISVFDRSRPLPINAWIDQSDGTAWMAFYSVIMMRISLELAMDDPVYQDTATKFFEHFLRIAGSMNFGSFGLSHSLWDEQDGFFYDMLRCAGHSPYPLKVRSLVGLLPLLAVETLEPDLSERCPIFARRVEWFVKMRPGMAGTMASVFAPGIGSRRLMAILPKEKLIRALSYMFDEKEFLSDYGIRSLSKYHRDHPYVFDRAGMYNTVQYMPAESDSRLYGGNSNWRGPIWFPINYLIIEALQKYHYYYGDDLLVEFPTGSGKKINLAEAAVLLSKRLISLFKRNSEGKRPIYGETAVFQNDPYWKDHILFNEYFHGDNGAGLGASHQTGWTALVAKLILQCGG